MMVLSGGRVPYSNEFVSQCPHRARRWLKRGSRFPECRFCGSVAWLRYGSLHEQQLAKWRADFYRRVDQREISVPPRRPSVDVFQLIDAMHNNAWRAQSMSDMAGRPG